MYVMQQHIPVGVARSVVESVALTQRVPQDPLWETVGQYFTRAVSSKYKATISVDSTTLAHQLFDLVSDVREEMLDNDVKPVSRIEAMTRFRDEIGTKMAALEDDEKRRAELKAETERRETLESRQWHMQEREETMSPLVETGRIKTLKEIAEDYALDYSDDAVRAALIAAFHGGAIAFHDAATWLRHDREVKVAERSWEKFKARDKATFQLAHEIAERARSAQ